MGGGGGRDRVWPFATLNRVSLRSCALSAKLHATDGRQWGMVIDIYGGWYVASATPNGSQDEAGTRISSASWSPS
jgi:hypothetical protein